MENWSITLDLMIILSTIEQFCGKLFGVLRRRRTSVAEPTDWMPSQPMPVPPPAEADAVLPNVFALPES